MVKLICMSFDGEYQTERPTFEDIDTANEYAADLGSKWFFYPFCFVTTESGKTIADACCPLDFLIGKRTATVAKRFAELCEGGEGIDCDSYAFYISCNF